MLDVICNLVMTSSSEEHFHMFMMEVVGYKFALAYRARTAYVAHILGQAVVSDCVLREPQHNLAAES